ncbi:hypothetical protein NDU88_006462 [Pleurodeles waltl]|uniref:Uncharacterized protein n=1 Tax=Pleurodeles waltl TaxID=8319 RepID=A0AAV7WDN3_PLEWA|nr:hypothetical protein NDU88_006462 [Pleurodeles waltl]
MCPPKRAINEVQKHRGRRSDNQSEKEMPWLSTASQRLTAGEVCLRKWRRYSSLDTVGKERLPDRRTCPQGYNASLLAQSCEEEVRPRQGAGAPKLKRCYAAEAELGVVLGLNQYRYCRGGALYSRHHAIR